MDKIFLHTIYVRDIPWKRGEGEITAWGSCIMKSIFSSSNFSTLLNSNSQSVSVKHSDFKIQPINNKVLLYVHPSIHLIEKPKNRNKGLL